MGAKLPTVTLGRLVMRGAEHDLAIARSRLLDALDHTPWPAADDDEVVVLRSVQVSGAAWRLADQVAHHAAEQASAAVDGWSAQADVATAIRFASATDMRACLLRDLLRGQAARRWYWQRQRELLALPLAQGLAGVLCTQVLDLPELLGRFETHTMGSGDWPALWQALDAAACQQTLASIAVATGWPVSVASTAAASPATPSVTGTLTDAARQLGRQLPWPTRQGTASQAASTTAGSARARLAALYLLWRHQPALLTRAATGAIALAQVERLLHPPTSQVQASTSPATAAAARDGLWPHDGASLHPPPPQAAGDHRRTPHTSTVPTPSTGTPAASASTTHRRPAAGAHAHPPDAPTSTADRPHTPDACAAGDDPGRAPTAAALAPRSPAPQAPDPGDLAPVDALLAPAPPDHRGGISTDESHFITQCGGLFYLLNALNLRGVQACLLGAEGSPLDPQTGAALGNGWCWLARLGQLLELPLDAPLQRFVATQAGLDEVDALASVPRLTDEPRLLALCRGRYGDDLWRAGSFALPARVLATRSHVDLHFRADDVSLAVRRSGLDIDPGWLPWLGRVVSFHYGSGRAPGGPHA